MRNINDNDCLVCDCYDSDMGCTMSGNDRDYSCSCMEADEKEHSILDDLQTICSFPDIFEDVVENGFHKEYRRKIGHIRADYDGYRWYNTVWRCHDELCSAEIAHEIDAVYSQLTGKNGFTNLDVMRSYCREHFSAEIGKGEGEYNFYFAGKHCLFWIRCITRDKDYNLYLHAFSKQPDD